MARLSTPSALFGVAYDVFSNIFHQERSATLSTIAGITMAGYAYKTVRHGVNNAEAPYKDFRVDRDYLPGNPMLTQHAQQYSSVDQQAIRQRLEESAAGLSLSLGKIRGQSIGNNMYNSGYAYQMSSIPYTKYGVYAGSPRPW